MVSERERRRILTRLIEAADALRLRRTFRFCTGALAAKDHDGVSFDLLVSPGVLRSRLTREIPRSVVVDDTPASTWSPWATFALQDLAGEPTGLREFLWSYGADAERPRQSWRPLVEMAELLRTADAVDLPQRAVTLVGASFPASEDCKRLKVDLFAPGSKLRPSRAESGSGPSLLALGTTRYPDAFAEEDLRLPDQARALWRADRTAATNLIQALLTEPLNVHGEAVLAALCDEVGPTASLELERVHQGILTVLLERSPGLAGSPSLWKVPLDRQCEFLDILMRRGADQVRSSVGAMIAAGTSELAEEVARALGADAAGAVLDAISKNEDLLSLPIGAGWSEVLGRDPSCVSQWLRRVGPSPVRLAFAIRHLDPRSSCVGALSPTEWLAATLDGLEAIPPVERLRCAAFLLAIGLSTASTEGARLVGLSYALVYRAASLRDGLPYEMWRWLNRELPPLHWYRDWDRCERLSFGLVERFARFDWPLQEFLNAARDKDALRQAVAIAREKGSGLLGRLREEVSRGALNVTTEQQRTIEERPRW